MASIVIGDNCDQRVTCTSANGYHRQKSPDAVVRSPCGCEKHACRHRNRYRRGDGKSPGAPFMKEVENGIQFPMAELAVQVGRSGFSCESERQVCSDHRSRRCNCRILVPRVTVAGSKDRRQDVGTSECGQWRAIDNSKGEKSQCAQVAKHCRNTVARVRFGILDEDVKHEFNISTSLDSFWSSGRLVAPMPYDQKRSCKPRKAPLIEQPERLPPRKCSRDGQRSQQAGTD